MRIFLMSYRTVLEKIKLLFSSDLENASPYNSYDYFIARPNAQKVWRLLRYLLAGNVLPAARGCQDLDENDPSDRRDFLLDP